MIVQVVPEQVKAGNIVLPPIMFPCVLDVAGFHQRTVSICTFREPNQPTSHEGNLHGRGCPLEEFYAYGVLSAVVPIRFCNSVLRLGETLIEVRRNVNFDPKLFRINFCSISIVRLWVCDRISQLLHKCE